MYILVHFGSAIPSINHFVIVSRTKLFEEGENDAESESAEKTPEPQSANTDTKSNLENSGDNFTMFLAHEESSSKWNHSNPNFHEEVMNFASQMFSRISVSDIGALFGVQRSNQNDLSCKPTWYGILMQFRRFEKSFHTKPRSDVRVIDFTNQPDSDFAKLDLPALFGELRSDQRELWNKVNCFEILTHQGRFEAWNHIKKRRFEKVMNFSIEGNLHLPYLDAERFGDHKNYAFHLFCNIFEIPPIYRLRIIHL